MEEYTREQAYEDYFKVRDIYFEMIIFFPNNNQPKSVEEALFQFMECSSILEKTRLYIISNQDLNLAELYASLEILGESNNFELESCGTKSESLIRFIQSWYFARKFNVPFDYASRCRYNSKGEVVYNNDHIIYEPQYKIN